MPAALHRRVDRDDEGFSLIELMVVILIIAILLAIAIPSFLGARARASDRAAQATLRNTLTAEKVIYTDKQAYTQIGNELKLIEPQISYFDASLAAPPIGQVALKTDTGNSLTAQVVCLTASSASGKSFTIVDETTGGAPGIYYFPNGATLAPATCDNAGAVTGGKNF